MATLKRGCLPQQKPAVCEIFDGDIFEAGRSIKKAIPSARIGSLVAGNSGRPGGGVGLPGRVDPQQVHVNHSTQEEDVMSSWMSTEVEWWNRDKLYRETIDGMWGMRVPTGSDCDTIQGVDYTKCSQADAFADAWVVRNCVLSQKLADDFDYQE